jgi:hypothetical protein
MEGFSVFSSAGCIFGWCLDVWDECWFDIWTDDVLSVDS